MLWGSCTIFVQLGVQTLHKINPEVSNSIQSVLTCYGLSSLQREPRAFVSSRNNWHFPRRDLEPNKVEKFMVGSKVLASALMLHGPSWGKCTVR